MTPEIAALEQSAHAAIARIARSAYAAKKLHTVLNAIALVEGYKSKKRSA
ncbi:MAG: hypothetical protein IGR90_06170 [Synechococcales cyanobacterium K32_A2020_035]|nr:hypothetical protein [Synechococcales cyanobacterium K32_A2020_035]